MDDELHPAGLVEETLEDDRLLCRQGAKRHARGGQVAYKLHGGGAGDTDLIDQPAHRRLHSLSYRSARGGIERGVLRERLTRGVRLDFAG